MVKEQSTEVAIIMGSISDMNVMREAIEVLKQFSIPTYVEVISAHRTPKKMLDFAQSARDKGFKVIIAGAGGAAHLPGMVASATTLPVIGVPINSSNSVEGIDSLLSIVQMPGGVPVASVAINGAKNAGILALQVLATSNDNLSQKLIDYKEDLKAKVDEMNKDI
ncbi:5-(carboxyamino)imidazole ribonucleotide mutase [Bacteriovoracaceae bacterium]|nr:5-(carboxyamino)imidazole ribonucleotide mutase [Bacteriovoracaceae bacterium]